MNRLRLADLPPVVGVTHRDVDIGEVRLHVAEAGAGPPLVLLHGWPQHWWSWRRLIPRLAESHRVLVPDLRGWGWSDAPPGDYAKRTFAADVLALLDAEGLDRVRVMGHDWGGFAAFLLALEHPERVERLVALDVVPPWPEPFRPRHLAVPLLASYQALLAMPVLGERMMTSGTGFVRTIIRVGSGPRARWSDDELDAYARVLCEPSRARASSACYRTFLARELPAAARRGDRSGELGVLDPAAHGPGERAAPRPRSTAATQPAGRDDRRRRALPARGGPGRRHAPDRRVAGRSPLAEAGYHRRRLRRVRRWVLISKEVRWCSGVLPRSFPGHFAGPRGS